MRQIEIYEKKLRDELGATQASVITARIAQHMQLITDFDVQHRVREATKGLRYGGSGGQNGYRRAFAHP